MQICKMSGRQINQALELIRKVFDECDKEDYEDMGILSFYHFIRREQIEERVKSGEMVFFGAYEESELVGVIAMRGGLSCEPAICRKKTAEAGDREKTDSARSGVLPGENPQLKAITVSASPKGKRAYEAMGFRALTPEQEKQGMRFTPMRLEL